MAVDKKATIIETGQEIMVYKCKIRPTWINSADCETEYKPDQLRF